MKNFLFLISCFLFIAGNAQKTKTFYVADRTISCGLNDCLQMKEKKKEDWFIVADSIKGFAYEEGYEYKVHVEVLSSGEKYKLLKILSKKKTGYNPAMKLEGKKWVLLSMFDSKSSMNLGDTTIYINISVADGKLTGHGICNNLKGELKAEGNQISFKNIGFTKKKCDGEGNIFEKIIQNLLEPTDTFKLKGRTLTLLSKKGSNMIFEKR